MASCILSYFDRIVLRGLSYPSHPSALCPAGFSAWARRLRMAEHIDGHAMFKPSPGPGLHALVSGASSGDSKAGSDSASVSKEATWGSGGDQSAVEGLVAKAQEGDVASFAALYEQFFDPVFRYVSFRTGNRMDAEDITGDVFIRMVGSISSFRWQGHRFSSWLFRIAHNLVVDYFRARARKATVPLEAAAVVPQSSAADPETHTQINLMMEHVYGAMESLTAWQREVISLRFAAGLSVAETAQAVGKKENAVKALQHAGLKKLKLLLAE